MKTLSLTVGLLLAACGAGISAQQGPSPEMRARLMGFVRALTSFDPKSHEALDRLHEEALHADFKKRLGREQLRTMAAKMHLDFGPFKVNEVRRRDPDTVVLIVDGAKGSGASRLVWSRRRRISLRRSRSTAAAVTRKKRTHRRPR